jgi:hypothetical protein
MLASHLIKVSQGMPLVFSRTTNVPTEQTHPAFLRNTLAIQTRKSLVLVQCTLDGRDLHRRPYVCTCLAKTLLHSVFLLHVAIRTAFESDPFELVQEPTSCTVADAGEAE